LALSPTHASADGPPLRIGLMPAVNSIPLILAEHLGYFERAGVRVELLMMQDQLTRETALQTGRIDGSISDMINAVAARANGLDVRVVARTEGVFALLAAPHPAGVGGLKSLADWKAREMARARVRTGLVESSIVTFLTEKMLIQAGVDPATIELVTTIQVPVRMELLLSGRIDAACLPEPMASVATLRGAVRIADSTTLPSTPGVLVFGGKAIRERSREIAAVLQACDQASAELNRNGGAYRDVVVSKGGFPAEVRDVFVLPTFGPSAPPPAAEVAEVEAWMKVHGLLTAPVAYDDLISRLK
jgi:NitT/TauT family transport system substrate-binding protein